MCDSSTLVDPQGFLKQMQQRIIVNQQHLSKYVWRLIEAKKTKTKKTISKQNNIEIKDRIN